MSRPDWASWSEAAGLTDAQVDVLGRVCEEAERRGLVVRLPVGDLAECALSLSEAGAEDSADMIHAVRS